MPKPKFKPTCSMCEFICSHGKWDVWKCAGMLLAKNESVEYSENSGLTKRDAGLQKAFEIARAFGSDPSVSPHAR